MKNRIALGVIAASLFAATSQAAQYQPAPEITQPDGVDIVTWNRAELQHGYSVKRLLGTEVRGRNGNSIGEIENLVVNMTNRQVERAVVESESFIRIGQIHFAVPWGELAIDPALPYVTVPVTAETVDRYSPLSDWEEGARPQRWRVTELLHDYVTLRDGTRYGIVDDLILDRRGQVKAIVIIPDVAHGGGRFAYPYRSIRGEEAPGAYTFVLPYDRNEIDRLRPFDYSALEIEPRVGRKGSERASLRDVPQEGDHGSGATQPAEARGTLAR